MVTKATVKRLARREVSGLARVFAALLALGLLAGCGGEETGVGAPDGGRQDGPRAKAERVVARDARLDQVGKRYDWRGVDARTLAAVAEIEDDASERLREAATREAEENGGTEALGRFTNSWVAAAARARLAGAEIEGRLALADLGRAEVEGVPLAPEQMVADGGGGPWTSAQWGELLDRHGYADVASEDLEAWAREDRERAAGLVGDEDLARVPGAGEAYAGALRLEVDAIEDELSRRERARNEGGEPS